MTHKRLVARRSLLDEPPRRTTQRRGTAADTQQPRSLLDEPAKPARRPRRRLEQEMQQAIIDTAKMMGYLTHHEYDSRRSTAGFPDLWIVGYGKLLVLENKTDTGRVSDDQRIWLRELTAAGVDARVYRLRDWQSGELVKELQAIKRAYLRDRR